MEITDTFDFKSVLSIQVPCMEFIDPVIFMKGPQFTWLNMQDLFYTLYYYIWIIDPIHNHYISDAYRTSYNY